MTSVVLLAVLVFQISAGRFEGTWKLNLDKSDVGAVSIAFASTEGGAMRVSGCCVPTGTFRFDGSEQVADHGITAAWQQVDARTWESAWRYGEVEHREHVVLAANEQTLTVSAVAIRPNRAAENTTFAFDRVSGNSGLQGEWRMTRVATQSEEIYEFVRDGADGMILKIPQATIRGRFDGQDYPVTSPNFAPGTSYAFHLVSPSALEVTQKQNGKITVTTVYEVSLDGRSLSATTTYAANPSQPMKQVFDRR
jgi:hypothetical protein